MTFTWCEPMTKRESLQPQAWEWEGPRVLLEDPSFGDGTRARVDALRRAGYSVAVCPGPTAGHECPLAGDDGCAAAHGADVVVSSLGLGSEEARAALEALRTRLPGLPVLVEADVASAADRRDIVSAGERIDPGLAPAELVARVDAVLRERRG